MSSLPSSSGSANGLNGHANGTTSHNLSDAGLESTDVGTTGSPSSEYPANGFSQCVCRVILLFMLWRGVTTAIA